MNKFDDFLKKTIKAILNDIRMSKENKSIIKDNLETQINTKENNHYDKFY